jgi:Zn-finger nucleic acid-binding protein
MSTPYRRSGGPPSQHRRCLFCGAAIEGSTCPTCSADRPPESTVGVDIPASCPRCGVEVQPVHLERAAVMQCPSCHGCFVAPGDWSDILDRLTGGRDAGIGTFVPPPPGRELSPEKLLVPTECPICRKTMERAPFAARSRVIIDICLSHGVWFDAGELVAAAQYVKAREERGGELSPEEKADHDAWLLHQEEWAKESIQYQAWLKREQREIARSKAPRGRDLDEVADIAGTIVGALFSNKS